MKFTLNLASRGYVNKRALKGGFIAVLCVLLIIAGWETQTFLAGSKGLQLNRQRLAEAQQELQKLRGGPRKALSSAERAQLEAEYRIVLDLLSLDAFRWTALLDRMETLLPDGVSLNGFQPDYKKKSLTLTGRAVSLKEMRQFLDRLLKNGDFKQVYLQNHSRIKVRDYAGVEQPAITFSLQIEGVF
jgi:type IV pilus assembly protein PilN